MRELTSVFDYFVIASGTSRRQLHAMSEEIDHALEDRMGDSRLGIEGYEEAAGFFWTTATWWSTCSSRSCGRTTRWKNCGARQAGAVSTAKRPSVV